MNVYKYTPRFVTREDVDELLDIWRTSATACAGEGRYARLVWTAGAFKRMHPEIMVSQTGVYKDLCELVR